MQDHYLSRPLPFLEAGPHRYRTVPVRVINFNLDKTFFLKMKETFYIRIHVYLQIHTNQEIVLYNLMVVMPFVIFTTVDNRSGLCSLIFRHLIIFVKWCGTDLRPLLFLILINLRNEQLNIRYWINTLSPA